jgi:hypothetical protein
MYTIVMIALFLYRVNYISNSRSNTITYVIVT